jgi:NAD(P)-dependent dehydrogenase (short-subunit alcohol dehydrogenase family)
MHRPWVWNLRLDRLFRADLEFYGIGGVVEDITLEELRAQFETNFFGAVALTKAVLPRMRERHTGRLIFVSSVNGLVGFPGLAAYCSSKLALEGFAESLRSEILPEGVYVSVTRPGSFPMAIYEEKRRIAAASGNPHSPYYARGRRLETLVLGRITSSKRDPRVWPAPSPGSPRLLGRAYATALGPMHITLFSLVGCCRTGCSTRLCVASRSKR